MDPALLLPTGHVKWRRNTLSNLWHSMAFQDLSAFGQASYVFRILFLVVPACLLDIIKAAIRAWLRRLSPRLCIQNVVVRAFMSHLPPYQIQTVFPSTVETYRAWMASAGKTPRIHILPDGSTRLLWLGLGKCSRVLLFFHGTARLLQALLLFGIKQTD